MSGWGLLGRWGREDEVPMPDASDEPFPEGYAERFWIGASTAGVLGSAAAGIRPFEIAYNGDHWIGDPVDVGENPMFLAHRGDGLVAIVHELADGELTLHRIDGETVTAVGEPVAIGADPCHVDFTADGRAALAANYSGGSLAVRTVRDGGFGDADVHTVVFAGRGPRDDRQLSPHAHQVVVDADRDRVLVVDLGADRVRVVHLDADGVPTHSDDDDEIVIHAGAGPRHLAISGEYAVVANELDRTLSVIDLELDEEIDVVPLGEGVEPRGFGASAIRITSGGIVLTGDRDLDGVQAHRLDPETGTLEHVGLVVTGGVHPRDLELTTDELHLLVADQGSDSIAIVSLDAEGAPVSVVATVSTPAPACIMRF
ncbi:hypothetical protein ET445_08195 [Agromyces protaetiae]|uniref:Lactonase family protein n=1 Tax=Agromyces protaetiae TaxID=2509455 RepID=A0A4P6FHE1_9MICO|nr:beta-propeller fold lactonase family protein [Agromyces protaetiae]QAY73327.1 hypothetical protein ET445_08195 [Agromyces protaetiae]